MPDHPESKISTSRDGTTLDHPGLASEDVVTSSKPAHPARIRPGVSM